MVSSKIKTPTHANVMQIINYYIYARITKENFDNAEENIENHFTRFLDNAFAWYWLNVSKSFRGKSIKYYLDMAIKKYNALNNL